MLQAGIKKLVQNKKKAYISAIILMIVVIFPVFVMAGRDHDVYVDAKANGTQNGSTSHPYKTIKQATKKANDHTKIHVANGTYHENVELGDGVELYGHDKDDVIIDGDDDKATVTMKDDSKINKVTIKGGKYGIKISDDEEASIIECIIKDNDQDGIHIENAGLKKSTLVAISENEIKENGRAGIYSQKRRLSIVDNDILNNKSDGIDLENSASAWIADNKINGNSGSGMKLRIDGSNIWTKNNTYRNNDHEGLEVSFMGGAGRVNIAKSDFIKNNRNGVAKVQNFALSAASANLWNKYLTFENNNTFSQNGKLGISAIIRK
jgi:hypothetical protein